MIGVIGGCLTMLEDAWTLRGSALCSSPLQLQCSIIVLAHSSCGQHGSRASLFSEYFSSLCFAVSLLNIISSQDNLPPIQLENASRPASCTFASSGIGVSICIQLSCSWTRQSQPQLAQRLFTLPTSLHHLVPHWLCFPPIMLLSLQAQYQFRILIPPHHRNYLGTWLPRCFVRQA
jgi:hypothetical protein